MSEEKKTIWQQITLLHKRPEDMPFDEYKLRKAAERDLYRMYRKKGISFKPVLTKEMTAKMEAYNAMVKAQELVQQAIEKEKPTDT